MFCRNCGSPLKDNANFCSVCGSKAVAGAAGAKPSARPGGPGDIAGILVFGVLFAVFIFIGTTSGVPFALDKNLINIFRQFAYFGTASLGLILAGRAGGIDLSIPWQMSLAGVVVASVLSSTGSYPAALAAGLSVCIAIGILNGAVITYLRFPSIAMTVLSAVLCHVLSRSLSAGQIMIRFDAPRMNDLAFILILIIASVCAFLFIFFTDLGVPFSKRTPPDKKAKTIYMLAYTAGSVFAFLGGLMLTQWIQIAVVTSGASNVIFFIFIFFLAGVSRWLDNRVFPVPAVLFACLFFIVLQNLLVLFNIASYTQFFLTLLFAASAVALDRVYRKNLFRPL